MDKKSETKENKTGITIKKEEDFSEWFTELITKTELADTRYNIKGLPVYREWAVWSMKKMTRLMEDLLEKKGHKPLIFPVLIPESNFKIESSHVEGFTPEVFWVTEHGDGEKFEEKYALRPTSETAFYYMYKYWIRSHKDLPYKRYQTASVYRYEGKMTRPFWRTRELHWIETHCAFKTREDAEKQLYEDIETTQDFLLEKLAIPYIFFQRPEWDKFAGADHTYAADALLDSGKVSQLPSTHHLGQHFSKPFGVTYTDETGVEQNPYFTCYGPCFSRIYGVMIAIHSDNKGLVIPFEIAPIQIVIVPIIFEKTRQIVLDKCQELKKEFEKHHYIVELDDNEDFTPGYKFNKWEMKGVPIRIEVGPKDIEKEQVAVYVRTADKKEFIKQTELENHLSNIRKNYTKNLAKAHLDKFKDNIVEANDLESMKKAIQESKIVKTEFCSIGKDGEACAAIIEKEVGALVRGKKVDEKEIPKHNCSVCGKKATEIVYIAKSY